MLTNAVKESIQNSVLCWLATASTTGEPNVSPKEMFTYWDDETILIAQIASPQSARNIRANPAVCISFVDIFVQKGFKLKGQASLLTDSHPDFSPKKQRLEALYGQKFPIFALFSVHITQVQPIIAPSYQFFPEETTEASQIAAAKAQYANIQSPN